MISFQALGVRFTLPLLTLIVPVLASRLGMEGGAGALMLALGAHELSHLMAAKLARVDVSEIRLMPFGGSARMENPYRLPTRQILPVAAAGPAANLSLAMLFGALSQWGLLDPLRGLALAQPNLILFLFNLLPALPLDGGRMLFCLLRSALGDERALKAGLWLGRLLSLGLAAAAVFAALRGGQWNLSFLLAAVFILASERDEKSALVKSRAQRLSDLLNSDCSGRPARLYQLDMDSRANQALRLLRPREQSWFVLTKSGRPGGVIDGRSILNYLIKDGAPDAALGDLPYYRISPAQPSGAKP